MHTSTFFSIAALFLSSTAIAFPYDGAIEARGPPNKLDAAGHQIYQDMKNMENKAKYYGTQADDRKADAMRPDNEYGASYGKAANAYAQKASGQWDL